MFNRPTEVQSRLVSSHDFDGFRVENVLFESLPGWEVNASVYLPAGPGRYPGVVCPAGHSDKTTADHQRPPQVFARNGYIAISFDPPDCSGEHAGLNDHFANGMVGYLTGLWSETHFVLDALRCIDYLATRPDVDATRGFAATGVSGGGMTAIFAALLDERISFLAPVCCLGEHEQLHLTNPYTSCPEQFGPGFIAAGLDYADYVALVDKPCLLVGGGLDEVFVPDSLRRVHAELDCELFIDEASGHAYTVAMAKEILGVMDRVWKVNRSKGLDTALFGPKTTTLSPENLLCAPHDTASMFTLNRDRARHLAYTRHVVRDIIADQVVPIRVVARSEPRPAWHVLVEEVDIQPEEGAHVFGVMFSHVEEKAPRPALLWIDEQGKWAAFKQGGFLAQALDMTDRDCPPDRPRILSVDVAGMGSMTPEPTAYDIAGWNNIERILSYLAIANGRPIMSLRVRDALAALTYLRRRPDVDEGRLMVGGRGVGAMVALHAGLLAGDARRVICADMLAAYEMLATQSPYAWPETIFVPGILERSDLTDSAAWLGDAVSLINPVDAQRTPLDQAAAEAMYPSGTIVTTGVDTGAAVLAAVTAAW